MKNSELNFFSIDFYLLNFALFSNPIHFFITPFLTSFITNIREISTGGEREREKENFLRCAFRSRANPDASSLIKNLSENNVENFKHKLHICRQKREIRFHHRARASCIRRAKPLKFGEFWN